MDRPAACGAVMTEAGEVAASAQRWYGADQNPAQRLLTARGNGGVPPWARALAAMVGVALPEGQRVSWMVLSTGYATENARFRNFCNSAAGALLTYSTSLLLMGKLCITKKLAGSRRSMR